MLKASAFHPHSDIARPDHTPFLPAPIALGGGYEPALATPAMFRLSRALRTRRFFYA